MKTGVSNNNSIRVLHFLNSAHGGSAISTFELIDELKKIGVTSSLVCFNNANKEQEDKIKALVEERVIFIPLYWMNKRIRASLWKRPLIELRALIETQRGYKFQKIISRFIQKHEINIIHTSTIVNPEGAIASAQNKLPHVWHARELVGPRKHFQFYDYARWSAYILNHSDVLVANSAATKQCLLEFFDETTITTIPNGINVYKFTVKQHTSKDSLVVGMVGSVTSQWKNHQFFLETAAMPEHHAIEFRIYGTLPSETDLYYKGLKNYIRENKISNVRFMGFSAEPAKIMSEIDVLFHPTHLESFGRIFIEAMAGGIPVIAIDEGGALEMVNHNETGFLIPLNNTDAAAREIGRLINDPILRNKIAIAGRKLVEEHYSLEVLANRIRTLYQGLLH